MMTKTGEIATDKTPPPSKRFEGSQTPPDAIKQVEGLERDFMKQASAVVSSRQQEKQ